MAKKSRRARRQRAARQPSTPPPSQTAQTALPTAIPDDEGRPTAAAPAARKQVDFRSEYRYVIDDLRSMAVIAVAMLVVLLALSFVIS